MYRKFLSVFMMAGLLSLGFVPHGLADGNSNPGVLPIGSNAFGKSYGEWAAEW